jgi:hypothetical protein
MYYIKYNTISLFTFMNAIPINSGLDLVAPRKPIAVIEFIRTTAGQTKSATLFRILAILEADSIVPKALDSEDHMNLMNSIHALLHEPGMEKYIQDIIDNKDSITIDPLIEEIFLGKYLTPISMDESIKYSHQTMIPYENK